MELLRESPGLSKGGLAEFCGKSNAWVSQLLHGQRGIRLDDVDAVAAYLSVTVTDLLGVPSADLTQGEQRMVLAFRALPAPYQDHMLALAEYMSIGARIGPSYSQRVRDQFLADGKL